MDTPRILIVEDEEGMRSRMGSFLSRKIECEIVEASDGRKALEMLEKEPFDLILLDIKMPGFSGLDILKKVKAAYPATEVIMVTAYDSEQVAREALEAGAADYIIKPSSLVVIQNQVVKILEKKKQKPADSSS